jgi:hypothetical protein
MRSRRFWIMDYETICNSFIACFEDYDSDDRVIFEVSPFKNEMPQFIEFLLDSKAAGDWHFGFNNLAFDAQITEYILHNAAGFSNPELDGAAIADIIYQYAQSVIQKSRNNEFLDFPEFKLSIPCVDIFKLNHWDNKAKRSSLKWIQFSMDWFNVEEMPHPHYEPVRDRSTIDMVIRYCINDVQSTKAIFNLKDKDGKKLMSEQINLRAELSRTYGVRLYSASEPKISKEIFLHFLSEKLNMDKRTIRDMRTPRENVVVRDILLPYIKFETPEFNAVHNWFKHLVVDTSTEYDDDSKKKGPTYRMRYRNVPTDYALGGLHGCIASGIYEASNGKKIMSADVTSFYPNLAIRNKWSPAHLPKQEFCELYEWMFEERKKYPKGSPLNYLFKIILNATYGLSKEKNSFLYDPELTFRITINGQLLLSMLYEMLATRIPGAQPLMQNTDGLEFLIDEEHEELFYQICKEWEEMTNLQLETVEYAKMIIGDVNNYIAVYKNGKTKCKGRFEFNELPLHKNKSMLIIPKAWYAYFIHGTDPIQFLNDNKDIHDYCAGAKLKGDWFFINQEVKEGVYHQEELKKLVRYYNSKRGSKLVKANPDGRKIQLESGNVYQTIFNKFEDKPWDEYEVDTKYYLDKIYSEIAKIENTASVIPSYLKENQQLSLF